MKRVRLEICRQRQQEINDAAAAVAVSVAAAASVAAGTSSSATASPQQQQQQRRLDAAFDGALRLGVQPLPGGIFTAVPGSNPFPALASSR